jgi:predicted transcriptional regulator
MGNEKRIAGSTAEIIVAYLSNNTVRREDLPDLIRGVHSELSAAGTPRAARPAPAPQPPAVPIAESVKQDVIICLEDGRAFRCLTKHLWAKYRMTPYDYRAKWGLAPDYPMSAPNYSVLRAAIARGMGLGRETARRGPGKASARQPARRG